MRVPLEKVQPLAEELMTDHCKIFKGTNRSGPGDYNAFDLTYLPPTPELIYDGPCMVTAINSFPSQVVIGGAPQIANYYWIRIPIGVDVANLQTEDVAVVDAVGPIGDLNLVDRQFIVQDYETSTYAAMRNIRVVLYQDVPT